MKRNALVKELMRYNWLVALIVAAYSLVFIYIFKNKTSMPVLFSIFVGIRSFVLGLFNMLIYITIERRNPSLSTKTKKWLQYATGYLLAFIFFFGTQPIELYLTFHSSHLPAWNELLPSVLLQSLMNISLVILVHNLVILRYEKANTDLENTRLRAANLESINLLLKQQIHPHFLFNALSMLKSLYKTDVAAGETYLSHLVNFLRASLTNTQSRVARVSEEIGLCNDYIEMQKIRFENALICNINIPGQVLSKGMVPSFSIQSLIENAIKHNEVTESSPLIINIFYKDGRILTENNLQVRTHTDASSGKGLINLVERYRILSGEDVIINQDNHTFSVSIKVLNNEVSDH